MEMKQNAIELLKETVEVLMRGQDDEQANLAQRIEDYLAAPSESAMEMVDQLDHLINDNQGIRADFDHNKAAALIESYGRRVPRAMLNEIIKYTEGMVEWDGEVSDYGFVDKFAAKHGVEVEG